MESKTCKYTHYTEPVTYPSKPSHCTRLVVKDGYCDLHWTCSYKEYKSLEDKVDSLEERIDNITDSMLGI